MKKSLSALVAVLAFVLLSAEGCEGRTATGTVNDISGPPLAQTLGCPAGLWSVTVDPDGNEKKSIDERAKLRKQVCVEPNVAAKYTPGSRYP